MRFLAITALVCIAYALTRAGKKALADPLDDTEHDAAYWFGTADWSEHDIDPRVFHSAVNNRGSQQDHG